ncbi:MAG TPA: B-box zinc finger protein [Myxococcaceae bacterium]
MERARCADHPGAIAGWQCRDCGRVLCPECVAEETLENGARFLSCSACDGRVDQLMEPGGTGTVRQHLWQIVQVPVSWFTVLLLPLTVWALWSTRRLEAAGTAAVLIFAVAPCFWALYFATVRSGAHAFDALGRGEKVDLLEHVVFPAARALVLMVGAAGPVTLVRWLGGDFAAPVSNPLLWVLLVLGALAMPLWTAYLAGGAGLASALSLERARRSIRELGADYWTVAGWTLALASLCFLWAGGADRAIRGPVFLLLQGLAVYFLLFVARFVGALLAIRGPELGFELRPDQLRPVLPDAVPRGTRKAKPPPPPPKKEIAPIELDEEAPAGPMRIERGMGGGGSWDPEDGER